MKKLLIFLLASGLFAACNDTNPFARKDKADKSDKEEKNDRVKKDDDGYDDKNTNYTGSSWSKKQRDELRNKCLDNFSDEPKAKQICSCLLDKMEQKYPDYNDAMSHENEDEIEEVAEDCEAKARGNDFDNSEYVTRDRNGGLTDEDYNATGWTDLQRQTFIKGCATAAQQQQGFTAQQANTYCDCMTRKVERKFSFERASKLTPADLEGQEWIDAAADCRSRIY